MHDDDDDARLHNSEMGVEVSVECVYTATPNRFRVEQLIFLFFQPLSQESDKIRPHLIHLCYAVKRHVFLWGARERVF